MNLKIKRFCLPEYTIGKLYIDGEYFCDTLEDPNRDLNKDGDLNDKGEGKVFGNTCIPFGTYDLIISKSPRFGRELPEILNVPHFSGIRIHRGNTHFDTHGCILVGLNKIKGKVVDSTYFEAKLMVALKKASDKITITIE